MKSILPTTVLKRYFPGVDATIKPIGVGMVNTSFHVRLKDGQRFILQRLSPIFPEALQQDFTRITQHLKQAGWEVPELMTARSGELWVRDDSDSLWRLMTYIDSTSQPDMNPDLVSDLAAILARLHDSFRGLTYTPHYSIPHFHETSYYMDVLGSLKDRLPRTTMRDLADKVLADYDRLPSLPTVRKQLIHGDPRANNALYRGGKPFTWIDYDAVMIGTIWIDIGDFLRSLAEEALENGNSFTAKDIHQASLDYWRAAASPGQPEIFISHAVVAMKLITLELAARFLIDIVEDRYFEWDRQKFASRQEFNWSRCRLQWEIYSNID